MTQKYQTIIKCMTIHLSKMILKKTCPWKLFCWCWYFQNTVDHWTLKAEFGTIAQLTNFFTRGFGNGMVLKSRNKTQTACNFMGVDGFVIGSSTAAMFKEFQGRLDALGMTHFEIFCEGNQGNLQFDYGDIVLHFTVQIFGQTGKRNPVVFRFPVPGVHADKNIYICLSIQMIKKPSSLDPSNLKYTQSFSKLFLDSPYFVFKRKIIMYYNPWHVKEKKT